MKLNEMQKNKQKVKQNKNKIKNSCTYFLFCHEYKQLIS